MVVFTEAGRIVFDSLDEAKPFCSVQQFMRQRELTEFERRQCTPGQHLFERYVVEVGKGIIDAVRVRVSEVDCSDHDDAKPE